MLEDPGLTAIVRTALLTGYGVEARAFTFVPGYDMRAATYEVASADGQLFAKAHHGSVADAPLEVPRALLDAGVAHVLAPLRTLASALTQPMSGGWTLVLYPFVPARNAMVAGMTPDQWRAFGATLRAVHDSGLEHRFADRLPAESFALPSAVIVRDLLDQPPEPSTSPAAARLASVLEARAERIRAMLDRAEELRAALATRPFGRVLCHADIHAANILVADDRRIRLIDWDGPMIAPRERDLLFVIGSRIARDVAPHEEVWFFEGYGTVEVDADALVYYRYERILEDIGEFARSVFGDPELPEASRESQVRLVESFFEPGDILDTAEIVSLVPWPPTAP
jgi:spectinomycin phosphotransferase